MSSALENPSLYAHVIHAILLMISVVLFIVNYSQIVKLGPYEKINLSLLFSGVVGVHAISHLGLESVYGYNPMKLLIR